MIHYADSVRIQRQRGGALLVMLVILVIGITTAFVSNLSSTVMSNKRNQTTAEALAQAKEALIGYAVSDPNRPGELPCPDTNNDGSAESNCSAAGASLVGRLPWRTLGLPDIRDSAMEHLWYVVSDSFHTNGSTPINSETTGTINLSGNVTANNLIAIVFAPGKPLSAQVRSTANQNNYLHYLESIVTSPTSFKKLTPNDQAGGDYTYNDQMVFITYNDLMPLVEQRIAREVKSCLNAYASDQEGRYPWAVPASEIYFRGQTDVRFGRVPYQPYISSSEAKVFLNDFGDLLAAVDACKNDASNSAMLDDAGEDLEDSALALSNVPPTTPTFPSLITTPSISAGYRAQQSGQCTNIHDNPGSNIVEAKMNDAWTYLAPVLDAQIESVNSSWSIQCSLFSTGYWNYWKTMVFYQVSDSYKPGGSGGTGSIKINGVGAYQAAVAVARSASATQMPRNTWAEPPLSFLEESNVHSKSTPSNDFETYRSWDINYPSVNDLVICVDSGSVNCQ